MNLNREKYETLTAMILQGLLSQPGAMSGMAMLSSGVAKGKIDPKAAKALLKIHKNSAEAVILTVEGLGLLMVEAAINAAMKVVKNAVNTAAGVSIL